MSTRGPACTGSLPARRAERQGACRGPWRNGPQRLLAIWVVQNVARERGCPAARDRRRQGPERCLAHPLEHPENSGPLPLSSGGPHPPTADQRWHAILRGRGSGLWAAAGDRSRLENTEERAELGPMYHLFDSSTTASAPTSCCDGWPCCWCGWSRSARERAGRMRGAIRPASTAPWFATTDGRLLPHTELDPPFVHLHGCGWRDFRNRLG